MASASPRRRELLSKLGIELLVYEPDIDESFPPGRDDYDVLCMELARRKIEAVLGRPELGDCRWFLAADTTVLVKNRVLGKPENPGEALEFLNILAGAVHTVVTGVALYDRRINKYYPDFEEARVRIAKMTKREKEWYIETGEWQGVAGGYRIQEKGALFIESIRGTYTNVMGLPMRTVYGIMRLANYPIGIKSSGNGRHRAPGK